MHEITLKAKYNTIQSNAIQHQTIICRASFMQWPGALTIKS